MRVMRFKMYSGFVVGFIFILIGAYMVAASPNKQVRDFFFIAGIISVLYSLLVSLMMRNR